MFLLISLYFQTAETVEAIVQQLMEKQRAKTNARTHECACDNTSKGNSSATDKKCTHTFHRIISPKTHSRGVLAVVSTAAANSTTLSSTTTQVSSTATTVLTTQTSSVKSEEATTKRATVSATVAVSGVTPRPEFDNIIFLQKCFILHESDTCILRVIRMNSIPLRFKL